MAAISSRPQCVNLVALGLPGDIRHAPELAGITLVHCLVWLAALIIGWDCLSHNGLWVHMMWEFSPFLRSHWLSPCRALTAGKCLPLQVSCKQSIYLYLAVILNTLRPRRNRRYFAVKIFKCIFVNENVWILTKILLKFIPKGAINNYPSLLQIMAWRRPGDKLLSEPTMVRSQTHIYASLGLNELTHCPLEPHTCVNELGQNWFR